MTTAIGIAIIVLLVPPIGFVALRVGRNAALAQRHWIETTATLPKRRWWVQVVAFVLGVLIFAAVVAAISVL